MGSGSGSAGDSEQAAEQGRHRRAGELSAWASASAAVGGRHTRPPGGATSGSTLVGPGDWPTRQAWQGLRSPVGQGKPTTGSQTLEGSLPQPGGGVPRPDPLVDSGSVGLRMFNLGTIPASVTPPRTWRRAAWFTILASAAALVGLVVIGSILVGPVRSTTRFDSLPNFPSGSPLATIAGPSSAAHAGHRTQRSPGTTVMTSGTDQRAEVGGTAPQAAGPTRGDAPVGTTAGTAGGSPGRGSTVGPPPPEVTTVSSDAPPAVDPGTLVARTRSFFTAVTTDVRAAADLTDGTVRDDAAAVIHQKYDGVSSIQVKSISLDPTSGLTISVLRVVDKDGSASTKRTTLHFTLGEDPKIENPGG
jgi:hypothetical protein